MGRYVTATLFALCALAFATAASADDKVTGQAYVRHDGGTDQGIQHCNDPSFNLTPVAPANGDSDPNDGGSRRQGNEPFSVVDPTDPDTIVAGWNDYCLTDLGAGWQGFAYSRDSGTNWTNSIVPGYPQDTSTEGRQSPLFGNHTDAGDPIAAFDNDGRLFVGGIAFNRAGPTNGDIYVATYGPEDQSNGYPVDYLRTVIIGRGTPSRNFQGIFQDKPMLEVDRTGGTHDGNVYVCWSRFTGFGQNKLYFSRSTDHGVTYSRPVSISREQDVHSIQGCDIAVENDGDVYVTFRTFNDPGSKTTDALAFARSTNGGASFAGAVRIRDIRTYNPSDRTRDCGDGPFLCPADFVFHRVPLEPRVTTDPTGVLDGVYLTYNEVRATEPSQTSYSSAGSGRVGQSLVYVLQTLDNGQSWTDLGPVDDAPTGHQFFPDIDALEGNLAVVWQDNRTDDDYSVQRPIGNKYVVVDGRNRGVSSGREEIVNTYVATLSSVVGGFNTSIKVSEVGHQSEYEMFGSRDIPFHGDYNWIQFAVLPGGGLFGYMTWTDNRDVVTGTDPREAFQDGFDVLQCRVDLGASSGSGLLSDEMPLARRDAPFSGDNCGNAGGLDQNIYGAGITLP